MKENNIKLFKGRKIRTKWDEEIQDYYYSIIDVIAVLTESKDPNAYWRKLKQRLINEGNQTVTNCHSLKMPAKDGKMRMTDVATTKQLLRLIQSVPSPNAEPFKLWLAQVGSERLDEIADPELSIERAINNYRQQGYSEEWISQRIRSMEIRKDLTAEWDRSGVEKGLEYAILTDEISRASFGLTTNQHKRIKGLKKENLRDNMTDTESALTTLAEVATREISQNEDPETIAHSINIARRGGGVAKVARDALEDQLGRSIISSENAKTLNASESPKEIEEQ